MHYSIANSRRDFLRLAGCGFGSLAFSALAAADDAPGRAVAGVVTDQVDAHDAATFSRPWRRWRSNSLVGSASAENTWLSSSVATVMRASLYTTRALYN